MAVVERDVRVAHELVAAALEVLGEPEQADIRASRSSSPLSAIVSNGPSDGMPLR